jgi:hypothetical protein
VPAWEGGEQDEADEGKQDGDDSGGRVSLRCEDRRRRRIAYIR